jgi:hypothetical protein
MYFIEYESKHFDIKLLAYLQVQCLTGKFQCIKLDPVWCAKICKLENQLFNPLEQPINQNDAARNFTRNWLFILN